MSENSTRQREREKQLFRYSNALERGDFETVAAVLRAAERDPILERMIWEINAVYAEEQAQQPQLSSASPNHNHHEEITAVTYPVYVKQQGAIVKRRYPITMIAALLIVGLLGAALFALRGRKPPTNDPGGLSALEVSVTVVPSATPLATDTPTPAPSFSVTTGTVTLLPFASIQADNVAVQIVCQATVIITGGANVFALPDLSSTLLGQIPQGTAAEVIIQQAQPDGTTWYFVKASVNGGAMQGWTRTEALRGNCPQLNNAVTIIPISPTRPPLATPFQVTVVQPGGTPTAAFGVSIGMGFLLVTTEQLRNLPAGARVRISHAGFNGDEWLYYIVPETDPNAMYEARSYQLTYAPGVTPGATPTSAFDLSWSKLVTRVQVGSIPAGTSVQATSGFFDGREWFYGIVTVDGAVSAENVPESQLMVAPASWTPTPTAGFDGALRSGGYALLTLVQIGAIPANTRVRVTAATRLNTGWVYDIMASDEQTSARATENQLAYAAGVTPGGPTPTAVFDNVLRNASIGLMTREAIGAIPANTPVRLTSAWYNGIEWQYQIVTLDGQASATVRESQLAFINPTAVPTSTDTESPSATPLPSPTATATATAAQ